MSCFTARTTGVSAPFTVQRFVRHFRRMVLASLQHPSDRLPHKPISHSACDVRLRYLRSDKHHERGHIDPMSAGGLDKVGLLFIIVLLLFIRVCNSVREGPRAHVIRSPLKTSQFIISNSILYNV